MIPLLKDPLASYVLDVLSDEIKVIDELSTPLTPLNAKLTEAALSGNVKTVFPFL